jgi:hypothetical protein
MGLWQGGTRYTTINELGVDSCLWALAAADKVGQKAIPDQCQVVGEGR